MNHDTKMLAGVAGVVVAGAAAIALLGGIAADRQAETGADNRPTIVVDRSNAEAPDTLHPAVPPAGTGATIEFASFSKPDTQPAPVTIEDRVEIDPAVDPVQQGLVHWNAREYRDAAAYFSAATEERPGRAWTHYILALSLWKSGDADGAVAEMETAMELDADWIKPAVNLSRIQNDRAQYDAALEAAQVALAIVDTDPEALFLEGRSLRNLGRRGEAIDSLRKSVAGAPDDGYAHNLLGLTLLELDRETEAVPALEAAVRTLPDIAYVHNNLGMAYERCGRRSDAVRHYRAAVDLAGAEGPAATNLARLDPTGATAPIVDGSTEVVEVAASASGAAP